jgi:hypothetical protein
MSTSNAISAAIASILLVLIVGLSFVLVSMRPSLAISLSVSISSDC